jgi:hypothetical protein
MRFAARLLWLSLPLLGRAGDLAFSDPARLPPPPPNSPGYPRRTANLDVLPGFRTPPPGYGEVAFYWWNGDPLTKERLAWQLKQLEGRAISSLQVNYAHSDKGGNFWGLTYPSQPPLFSPPWWDLFSWFLKSARAQGMAVSLSDYTLGWPGNGGYVDEMLRSYPEISGAVLKSDSRECTGPGACRFALPPALVSIVAADSTNRVIDLRPHAALATLTWTPPPGRWRIHWVYAQPNRSSIDPMHPHSGAAMIEKFFQPFEDRNPGEAGKGLNFFFSDELNFGLKGWLWNASFPAEFRQRKGYDIVPELPALFHDLGPRTPKVRLDYSDVMVALEEENYFRPLFDWHHQRGMLYGCDHGGRGRDVVEFGDYFRTQRWMSAPGADQPGLRADVVKNKVASSIAHLYERQRTWLEGYYGSGWGTSTAQLAEATWRNFAMGQNLLTLHGLYYTTLGGWWEWAPPCNHFRMPYWAHLAAFLKASERMSYLLSQGHHRADVAILYPVASMEAGLGGPESVKSAFDAANHLYEQGLDFDFIDFESLARAQIVGGELRVAGEAYRALVLPAMRAVRHSTIEKALAFHRAKGLVAALGALPEASDRVGAGDPELDAAVREIFSAGNRADTPAELVRLVPGAFPRDFSCAQPGAAVQHRRIGPRDLYFVYGAPKGTECQFRAVGRVELWDPWTGQSAPLPVLSQSQGRTTLRLPLEKTEAQLIVFSPGQPVVAGPAPAPALASLELPKEWEFELHPTLDNRFGDYRAPASPEILGAEVRRFRYAPETSPNPPWHEPSFDDSAWPQVTYTYGPRFWKLGPFPAADDPAVLETALSGLSAIDARFPWQPYEYSLRWGVEGDPGHQGYHGLKGLFSGESIALGVRRFTSTTTVYDPEKAGARYYLWTSVPATAAVEAQIRTSGLLPARVWINGQPAGSAVALRPGSNPVLLRYDQPGRGGFALESGAGLLFDVRPREARPAGWYRFQSAPGLRALSFTVRGTPRVWVAGRELPVEGGPARYRVRLPAPAARPAAVAVRIQHERGYYGGAAFEEPVQMDCGPGLLPAGDWSLHAGLSSYSGGAWYRIAVNLTREQIPGAVLDLGHVVSSAELRVNGRPAGLRLAPPWKFDLAPHLRPGPNRLEILVYNTLANHYQTIPTRYRGSPASGLIGPVKLTTRRSAP